MRHDFLRPTLFAAVLGLAACTPPANEHAKGDAASGAAGTALTATELDSDKARISYIVGRDFARSIEPIRGELDPRIVLRAIRDAQVGAPMLFDEAKSKQIREGFSEHLRNKRDGELKQLAVRNLEAGEAFLKKNAKVDGVVSTASGLQYQMLRAGKGEPPKASDTVRVNYVGRLLDGSKFESTYDTDHPAEFVLAQVMPGWTEAVQLMTPGSRYRFWIPAKLAYGEQGLPGQIEPNATLAFEVELLEVAGQGAPMQGE